MALSQIMILSLLHWAMKYSPVKPHFHSVIVQWSAGRSQLHYHTGILEWPVTRSWSNSSFTLECSFNQEPISRPLAMSVSLMSEYQTCQDFNVHLHAQEEFQKRGKESQMGLKFNCISLFVIQGNKSSACIRNV